MSVTVGRITFSPGPWRTEDRMVLGRAFDGRERLIVERVRGGSPEHADGNAHLIAAAPDLLEVARIEEALHMRGFTKATAKSLGPDAEAAYLSGGVTGLNSWRSEKRAAAIAKTEGRS